MPKRELTAATVPLSLRVTLQVPDTEEVAETMPFSDRVLLTVPDTEEMALREPRKTHETICPFSRRRLSNTIRPSSVRLSVIFFPSSVCGILSFYQLLFLLCLARHYIFPRIVIKPVLHAHLQDVPYSSRAGLKCKDTTESSRCCRQSIRIRQI